MGFPINLPFSSKNGIPGPTKPVRRGRHNRAKGSSQPCEGVVTTMRWVRTKSAVPTNKECGADKSPHGTVVSPAPHSFQAPFLRGDAAHGVVPSPLCLPMVIGRGSQSPLTGCLHHDRQGVSITMDRVPPSPWTAKRDNRSCQVAIQLRAGLPQVTEM